MVDDLREGTRVGEYVILERLGAGSMGQVFRARQEALRREVALKVMPGDPDPDSKEVQRFLREGKIQARLSHANLVKIHDRGAAGPWLYIAMEFVPGRSLGRILAHEGVLDPERSLEICLEIARGLSFLHASRILHRDLKADNVMVEEHGVVKICDFGLARYEEDTLLTADRRMIGTLATMAPEILTGQGGEEPADIYSLGVILYQMLSGRLPHPSKDSREFLNSVVKSAPLPFPGEPAVPGSHRELCFELIRRDPGKRPTAEQVVECCERLISGRSLQHRVKFRLKDLLSESIRPSTPSRARRRSARGVLAAVLGLGAVLGAAMTFRRGPAASPSASATATAPSREVPLGERHLRQFLKDLETPPTRVHRLRPGERDAGLEAWFWQRRAELDRQGRQESEGGTSCWFLVLEPARLESATLSFEDGAGAGAAAELEVNGQPVPCPPAGDGWRAAITPARLRRGLNHAWIRTGSQREIQVAFACEKSRTAPVPGVPPGIDWGHGVSMLTRVDPAARQQFFDCWSRAWTGLFEEAILCAGELKRKYPGLPEHHWFDSLLEVMRARMVRDVTRISAGGNSDPVVFAPANLPDVPTLARTMAESVDSQHRFLREGRGSGLMWRVLGETLVSAGEPELGWACLKQACLSDPSDAVVWFGFFSTYDFEHDRHPMIASQRPLVKETLQVAASLVAEPQDVMDERMRKFVLDGFLALERNSRSGREKLRR